MIKPRPQAGFTLVEAIVTMVIIGIVAGMVGMFIRTPIQQYQDIATRAELTDTADAALRRIGRDLRLALPNSARISGNNALEILQTRTGGRYAAPTLSPVLDYTGKTFSVLSGSMTAIPAKGEYVVIYNLGQNIDGANAYAGDNISQIDSATATSVTLTNAFNFPLASPGLRFQVVESPVTYLCDTTAGTLTRYWGYAIKAAQPTDPVVAPLSAGQSSLLAQNVTDCAFTYGAVNERMGLVTLTLSLTRNNETVTLYHEVHVNNVP
ncbi:MAG: hypothetical protein H6R01_967 [Burkholderiaceae bacterium]|nr:hypothetical protein [Burkholderiaceae bacterium]